MDMQKTKKMSTSILVEIDKKRIIGEIMQRQFSEIYKRAADQWRSESERINNQHY